MRQCIFCPSIASTREDAWPKWLIAKFQAPTGVLVSATRRGQPPSQWKQAQPWLKARVVCKACNNGWMSSLEGRTKPIIEHLLAETPVQLGPNSQSTLATWTLKTAMVVEVLRGEPYSFYKQEEREALRIHSIHPSRTAVWLSKCVEQPTISVSSSDHTETMERSPEEAALYVTTLAFGHIALQVATVRLPSAVAPAQRVDIDVRQGPWEDVTLRLGLGDVPPVTWPPRLGLNGEEGLSAFESRWFPPPGP